jgi:hypothetical protein
MPFILYNTNNAANRISMETATSWVLEGRRGRLKTDTVNLIWSAEAIGCRGDFRL